MVKFEIDETELLELFPNYEDENGKKKEENVDSASLKPRRRKSIVNKSGAKITDAKFSFKCYRCPTVIYCYENMARHFTACHNGEKVDLSLANWSKIKCYLCEYR